MSGFPATRHSAVVAIRSDDPAARARGYDAIVSAYWRPVYVHLRHRWNVAPEEARDQTQGFFAEALEKGWLERYDRARARFRTWLRVCLDGYASHAREAAARAKRGGGWQAVSLDVEGAERIVDALAAGDAADPEAVFQREWARSLLEGALADLAEQAAASGRESAYRVFLRADVESQDGERPSYQRLAEEEGVPVSTITNHLHRMRREFRRCALDRLRALTLDDDEFRAEARALLGRDTP